MLCVGAMASADMLGLHFGIGVWQNESDGNLFSLGLDQDTSTLNMDDDNATFFYIKFEHPVPVMPNIRIAQSAASNSGTQIDVGGIANTSLETEIDLDHTDFTFYWELIDTGMDLDLGLTARRFDGALIQDYYVGGILTATENQPIEGTIPMLYISANVDLPFTGGYVGAEINSLSYRGDGFNDVTAKLGWKTENWIMPEFGVELGYRKFGIDIDATNSLDATVDLSMDGYYLALVGHF